MFLSLTDESGVWIRKKPTLATPYKKILRLASPKSR